MSRTVCKEVYKFNELSEDIQGKVVEKHYNINVEFDDWYEFTIDDAKEIGKLMGIEIKNIYFSGFSSQGDGACFEGYYEYEREGLKKVKDYAPVDERLHRIAKDLQDIQRKNFYQLKANVKQSGHYLHEYCTRINVDRYDDKEMTEDAEDKVIEYLRDFMRWIYRQLEQQYDYLTSEEAIIETIQANEYEYTEDGEMV